MYCISNITESKFVNNFANIQGGAISYTSYRPYFYDNTYLNNSSPYGNDIGSFGINIYSLNGTYQPLIFSNIASG